MLATDKLGDLNVCGLSAIDACLRQWISVRPMPKDVGCYKRCWLLPPTCLCSVLGDNTISISKDGMYSSTRPNGAVASSSPDGGGLN